MPMKSWLMEVCSNSHTKRELHGVCQPEDACHLLQEKDRPRKEDIEKMCLKGFFTKYETQCIYSEEEGYEDISQFQELGCNFKFSFSMRLSGTYLHHFTYFKGTFSCHVLVHLPHWVVMPPLIFYLDQFGDSTHNMADWFIFLVTYSILVFFWVLSIFIFNASF